MSFESISGDTENNRASSGVSRRSVLKVGAHAAWAVPLVQVVAAAPAMAAVSGPAKLTITGTGSWGAAKDNKPLQTTVQVGNTGGQSATVLTVVFSFPAGYAPSVRPATLLSGWSAQGNGTPTITLSSNGTTLTPATSFSLSPVFDLSNANNRGKAVTVGLTANGSGGLTATGSIVVA